MERRRIDSIREEYRDLLIALNDKDRALEINNLPIYAPLLKTIDVHPEEEPDPAIFNDMINEVIFDTMAIDAELCNVAVEFKDLMESTKIRLNKVKSDLATEKERQQDINILCNQYTDFGSAINLTAEDFSGEISSADGIFSAKVISTLDVPCSIINVEGNGYEGNRYVYKDDKFLSETIDTGNRKFITDNSTITAYEYSRITASNTEKEIFPLVNFDSLEAVCVLTLKGDSPFNVISLNSDLKDNVVQSVLISEDGNSYKEVIKKTLNINNREKKYEVQDYIPGSGMICFPSTRYVKIVLQSNAYTDDTIAFEKETVTSIGLETKTIIVKTAKRHVVRVNDITAKRSKYLKSSFMRSKELITTPVNTIALFCNEYVPEHLTDSDCIKYILTINGIDHEIIPLNAVREGKKIIRTTNYGQDSDYSIYINENIKSAKLTVLVTSEEYDSPYVSNIKVLIGGN